MDASQVKQLIVEWVKIEKEITKINDERKKYNRHVKDHTIKLRGRQKDMENPILNMMNQIDTESIDLNNNLVLKSKQISKTTGITKKHITDRVKEYLGSNRNTYTKILFDFAQKYNVNIPNNELQKYISQFTMNETDALCAYITDLSARKVFLDEEKLLIGKR